MYIMHDYDQALMKILYEGFDTPNKRTGISTRNYYGITTRYDISERVPILTRRKVNWKVIVAECLWYIKGSDNIYDLQDMGSHVWDSWIDDEFTDENQLSPGSIGYGYGPNLTSFGGELYGDPGFNQLDYVIRTIREDVFPRRSLFTLWRPDKLYQVKIPACHHTYQFLVTPDKDGNPTWLSCFMYQRSNDYPIGVGHANLFTGTLFTYMIAQQVGLKPLELIHSGSHCHIYSNNIPQVQEYLSRKERPSSPILKLNKRGSIYDYKVSDFEVEEYNPLQSIRFEVAI